MATRVDIPARFAAAYRHVQRLERGGRYLGAFIFGSLARGEATARSDLDVQVLVDADNPCANINHPVIGGVKLDLTFLSLAQLRRDTEREVARAVRVPMLAESVIVFDKTGDLGKLRAWARQATPPRATPADFQLLRFLVFHAHSKVARALESDPPAALLAMHLGLKELFDIYRRLEGRWEVSSKRLLPELRAVDPPLAGLVEAFVATADPHAKFRRWTEIVAHIARPLGGWADAENTCDCAVCRADLAALLHG
jgi:predicted nucleotidyltransferase